MAVSLKHNKVSAIADNPAAVSAGEVVPSDWNAEHVLTMATARMLGRTTAGTGAVEELTAAQVLSMIGALATSGGNLSGALGINGADAANFYAESVPLAIQKNQNAISTIGFSNNTVGAAAGVRTHFVTGTGNSWFSNALYDGNGVPYHRQSYGSAVTETQWMFNGVNKMKLGQNGNLSTGGEAIGIGEMATGNRYAYVDFNADDTHTDWALRIIRNNTGANASSEIKHRGTSGLYITTVDAASLIFQTTAATRMSIMPGGNVLIGPGQIDDTTGVTVSAPAGVGAGISLHETSSGGTARLRIYQNATEVIYNATWGTTSNAHLFQIGNADKMRIVGGYWTTSSWGRAAFFPQSHVVQWDKGAYSYSYGLGQSGDNFYFTRSAANDGSSIPYYWLTVAGSTLDATFYANVTAYSDIRKKQDVAPAYLSLDDMLKVSPIIYTHIDTKRRACGVSAQDLERVLPLTVIEDKEGYKSVDYGRAALVMVTSLAREVAEVKAEVQRLRHDSAR